MSEELETTGQAEEFEGPKIKSKLTPREEAFCKLFIADRVGSRAAIAAGYTEKIESAYRISWELQQKPHIKARLKELQAERNKEYEVTHERIREEYAKLAYADTTRLIKEFGGKKGRLEFSSLADIPEELKPAIKSISQYKDKINVTFHDKTAALDALAKHTGFFEADNKQKAPGGVAIYLPANGRDPVIEPKTEQDGSNPVGQ